MTREWRLCVLGIGLLSAGPRLASSQVIAVPSSELEWDALSSRLRQNPYVLALADRETALAIVAAAVTTRPDGLFWAAYTPGICIVPGPDRARMDGESRREAFRASAECLERILLELPALSEEPRAEMVRGVLARPMAEALFEAGELAGADSIASEELRRLPSTEAGMRGNVQYEMNQVRGRVALQRGQRAAAIEFLHQAGQAESSPQLTSFGPRFRLARDLLEVGETEAVLAHLDAVGAFWTGPDATTRIEEARRTILAGGIPDDVRWR